MNVDASGHSSPLHSSHLDSTSRELASKETDPAIVTCSTIAKRTFTIIGCVAASALVGAAITLPFLPLWPALAIITGIALLALAISSIVVFCTQAFTEPQTADDTSSSSERSSTRNSHSDETPIQSEQDPSISEEASSPESHSSSSPPSDPLPAEIPADPASPLLPDLTATVIQTASSSSSPAIDPLDAVYDELVAEVKRIHQAKVARILRYFPELRQGEDLEAYLRSSSNHYTNDFRDSLSTREHFKQRCLRNDSAIVGQQFLPNMLEPLWQVYQNNTLLKFLVLGVTSREREAFAIAAATPLDSRPPVGTQVIAIVQSQIQEAMNPSIDISPEIGDLYDRILVDVKVMHRERVAKILERFPLLRISGENTDEHAARANDYTFFAKGVHLPRMQTLYQQAKNLETVKNAVTAGVLKRLWSDYQTFAQKTFETHYPEVEWPSVETVDQQDPA